MKSRYKRGDRLYHIDRKISFRYLDANKIPTGNFYKGKENFIVEYEGIDDNGFKVIGHPETVRLIQKDNDGEFYRVNNKRFYITKNKSFLYHGSKVLFKEFSDEFIGVKDANDEDGAGIYLTNNIEEAKMYGKYLYYLKLTSNKKVPMTGEVDLDVAIEFIKKSPRYELSMSNYDENIDVALKNFMGYIEHDRLTNPYEFFQKVWYDVYRYEEIAWARNMVDIGYDYAVVKKRESSHIVVYNPKIINIIDVVERKEE